MARIQDDDSKPDSQGLVIDDTPDEIADFVLSNGIGEKYQMILKEHPAGGGKPMTLKSYSNWHPNINDVGEQWGPGEYELCFSWKTEGMNGKKEPTAKSYKIALPERAWGEAHERYLERRRDARKTEKLNKLEEEADRARIFGQAGMTPPVSEIETMKRTIETLKSLGVPIGGPQVERKDWTSILVGLAPVLAALGPVLMALINKQRGDGNSALLNTLVTKMLDQKPQGESDTMKTVVPFLMGTMQKLFEMKEAMKPEEKEPFIERMFDKLASSLPMLMEFAKMSKPQREGNLMFNMAKNHPDVQTMLGDIELQVAFVTKLDSFYGFQQTNQILEVMGVPRPAVTAGNAKVYPSKGYEEATPAPGRPPQEAPQGAGTPPEDEEEDDEEEDILAGQEALRKGNGAMRPPPSMDTGDSALAE